MVTAGGIALETGEYDLVLETTGRPEGEALALLPGGGFLLLDTTMTPELAAEGLARDVVRAVQDTRKAAGFDVSDRIRLDLAFVDPADAQAVASAFGVAEVAGETLATRFSVRGPAGETLLGDELDGRTPDHSAEFAAGTFANAGAFTVSVERLVSAERAGVSA